ncbi:flagellar biosynthesis protein FlhA [Citricoccus sp. I39-566]|uniref:flagellar biosynthesis protein FlhA n=1 Tax=Citricoccus sp. I39-566 TaxID=3073268 RepID=UPI00286CE7C4|nr:flagellar biosynthesis protein FlhA [Citricoccus sp. I39-566]WMY77962.1 flagellar biosynthesis protein FlhA [Citricoccus sp. I39-566]
MNLAKLKPLAMPIGFVLIVLLLIVPVPAPLLDVLIVVSISLSLVILLNTMFVKKPLDFSIFPSLLLAATMLRLGINVASTRLVLGEAHAGQVIDAFGQVAVGGNMVIGFVVFLILVIIQFVVITKGAERVSEVGARFTLDAMPGKQMAIDADLAAGLITEDQARTRRGEVTAEADFYGAMDGASKFVKGDAIAGIIILVINLVGGVVVGMMMHGMDAMEALETYALLSIGDGLVTIIPSVLMATATGMIVTRSTADEDLGTSTTKQLSQFSTPLVVAGVAAIAMGLIPGMPLLTFLVLGVALILAGRAASKARAQEAQDAEAAQAAGDAAAQAPKDPGADLIARMRTSPVEVHLATDIVDLANGSPDDLVARIRGVREQMALSLGFVIPQVRTRDNVELLPGTYRILIAGTTAAEGQAPARRLLALGGDLAALPGAPTREAVFGLDGKWIPEEMRTTAEMAGSAVFDRTTVVTTQLASVLERHAARLLSRADVQTMLDAVAADSPETVEDVVPALVPASTVHQVLQGLLSEGVPINDLPRILETIAQRAGTSKVVEHLVEASRLALAPVIAERASLDGVLTAVTLDPVFEQGLLEGLRTGPEGSTITGSLDVFNRLADGVRTAVAARVAEGEQPVLVCGESLRADLARKLDSWSVDVAVLSYTEASSQPGLTVRTAATVGGDRALA